MNEAQWRSLVRIEALPPEDLRYSTEGDWQITPTGEFVIQVTANMPQQEQLLLALHELIEAMLCQARGITQQAVDRFDFAFKGEGEPGDAVNAPYRLEHRFAALIDHLIAHELGIDGYGRVDWEAGA